MGQSASVPTITSTPLKVSKALLLPLPTLRRIASLKNYLFCGGLAWRSGGGGGGLVWSLACIQLGTRNVALSR